MTILSSTDIDNINTYLKKNGIKYLDVRYELIDHLVSEYEQQENRDDLQSFLFSKLGWCQKISKEKGKSIHWGYQKMLWKRIINLFKKPVFYILLLMINLSILQLLQSLNATAFFKILFISMLIPPVIQLFFMIKTSKVSKKIVSALYVQNIYAIPQLMLSMLVLLLRFFKDNIYFFLAYYLAFMIISIAALQETYKKEKEVMEQYSFLKKYIT